MFRKSGLGEGLCPLWRDFTSVGGGPGGDIGTGKLAYQGLAGNLVAPLLGSLANSQRESLHLPFIWDKNMLSWWYSE